MKYVVYVNREPRHSLTVEEYEELRKEARSSVRNWLCFFRDETVTVASVLGRVIGGISFFGGLAFILFLTYAPNMVNDLAVSSPEQVADALRVIGQYLLFGSASVSVLVYGVLLGTFRQAQKKTAFERDIKRLIRERFLIHSVARIDVAQEHFTAAVKGELQ